MYVVLQPLDVLQFMKEISFPMTYPSHNISIISSLCTWQTQLPAALSQCTPYYTWPNLFIFSHYLSLIVVANIKISFLAPLAINTWAVLIQVKKKRIFQDCLRIRDTLFDQLSALLYVLHLLIVYIPRNILRSGDNHSPPLYRVPSCVRRSTL